MNTRQSNKLASYIATQAVLEANPEIAAMPGLPAKVAEFSAKVAELNRLGETQEQGIDGKMARRDQILEAMAGEALRVAGVVLTVANEQKLTEIAAAVRLSPADFGRVRQTRRTWLARQVLQAARSIEPQLQAYGVTAETVNAFEARIETAMQALHEPRSTIADKRSATRRIPLLIDEIDQLLGEGLDRLLLPTQLTHRAFYEAYAVAREVVDRRGPRRRRKEGEGGEDTPRSAAPAVATPPSTAAAEKAA